MKLSQLLSGVTLTKNQLSPDTEITSLSYDTRTLEPGALFVALSGYKTDGHRFVTKAVELGAAAVLCQYPPEEEGPWLVTGDARAALAIVSDNWFHHPTKQLTMLGITGTNGKTTTTYLLKAMLEKTLGARVGLIGTNQNMIGDTVLPAHRTTPESYELQELCRRMADAGCTHVVMEVSSHALALHRVDGIRYRAGIFTNLTQDHLDFHGTMEEYRRVKGLLFPQCDAAVLNLDDEAGRYYAETVSCARFTYSENKNAADVVAKNIRLFPNYVEFEAVTLGDITRVHLPIPGGFSIYNALGVIACGLTLGIRLGDISAALRTAKGVKGRLEVVQVPAPYTVLIDYAHSPDALENVLTTVRDFTKGRLICVFGCGGDRDRTKRPIMGSIAGALSDVAVVTSDNPRTEPPDAIIGHILEGMKDCEPPPVVEPDRRRAIRLALDIAKPGDVVVLAGKGHETYQEIDGMMHHLDEREEIAAYFHQAVVNDR